MAIFGITQEEDAIPDQIKESRVRDFCLIRAPRTWVWTWNATVTFALKSSREP